MNIHYSLLKSLFLVSIPMKSPENDDQLPPSTMISPQILIHFPSSPTSEIAPSSRINFNIQDLSKKIIYGGTCITYIIIYNHIYIYPIYPMSFVEGSLRTWRSSSCRGTRGCSRNAPPAPSPSPTDRGRWSSWRSPRSPGIRIWDGWEISRPGRAK